MRVLLVGASGFIGRSIATKAPEHFELTGTYHRNKPNLERIELEQFNFLDASIDWSLIVKKYDCIIIAARATGIQNQVVMRCQGKPTTPLLVSLMQCEKANRSRSL